MTRRSTRTRAAALAAGFLASASLVTISSATFDSASAACAPGLKVVKTTGKATKAKVRATKPAVTKVGKKYVARSTVTATAGKAAATVTQTVCPDGAAGAAAASTQTAAGQGTLTKQVTKKAASKKKAVKAVKAAQKKARKSLAAKAKKRGKKLALAAAKSAAATKAHHTLYDSSAYWILVPSGSGDQLTLTTTQPAGAASFTAGPGGVPVFHIPATPGSTPSTHAVACLTKAPAWPTAFLDSAAGISSPDLRAAADVDNEDYGLGLTPVNVVNGTSGSGSEAIGTSWIHEYDGSGSTGGVTEKSSFQPSSGSTPTPTPYAGNGLCVLQAYGPAGGATVTLGGLAVSATFDASTAMVTGGVPVTLG